MKKLSGRVATNTAVKPPQCKIGPAFPYDAIDGTNHNKMPLPGPTQIACVYRIPVLRAK